jgi:hypothetical protein
MDITMIIKFRINKYLKSLTDSIRVIIIIIIIMSLNINLLEKLYSPNLTWRYPRFVQSGNQLPCSLGYVSPVRSVACDLFWSHFIIMVPFLLNLPRSHFLSGFRLKRVHFSLSPHAYYIPRQSHPRQCHPETHVAFDSSITWSYT